ncbi:MAG TPA: NUDIX hydrolase [Anaerolineae bacterium]|nr:NUDIX hydrolase [Anaerolineae bacterium]
MPNPQWLTWARALRALAQAGLTYTENPFDKERYVAIQEIAAEMMATGAEADLTTVHDLFAEQAGYETPKVDVRGVVFRDDRLLLVRELQDGGRWTLPGGWADINEPPSTAVAREVWEESGYETRAVKLLLLYDRDRHGHPPHAFSIYKLFFLCELLGGEPSDSHETGGADFFAEDAIPDLSISRVTPKEIARLFEHHRHPEWPTEFD